jgi:hypothetical protein
VNCEEVRAQLPDYVLGTLDEPDRAAVRGHLRGCSVCRAEAIGLDQGVGLFASAAHEVPPPPNLGERVMSVLSEEWAETPSGLRPFERRWLLMAAAALVLIGVVVWGALAQASSNRNASDADAYRELLATLGGTDVRVASLTPIADSGVEGTAILYDSTREQSWGLILVRAREHRGELLATLVGPHGHTIELFPIELEQDGEGSTWLVTSSDISNFSLVRVTASDGTLVAQGVASDEHQDS